MICSLSIIIEQVVNINKFSRMIISRPRRNKSMGCLALQQDLRKQQPLVIAKRKSESQFLPFQSERKLGKLIFSEQQQKKPRLSNQELIERITFKNFDKIYKVVLNSENKKYSEQTRASGQKNVINHEWKLNALSKLPHHQHFKQQTPVRSLSNSQGPIPKTNAKFDKMNQFLFKKLSKIEEPSNPELHELYTNYIKVSELNENIKREELTGKSKVKPLS